MKIKVYLVTYKGHKRLLPTLTSLFNSDLTSYEFEVNIINNHSDIRMPPSILADPDKYPVNILHNVLRPDFSSGHLSRSWNQALVNGFESLTNPDCDVVVCSQDDSVFHPHWVSRLESVMKHYTFVQNGHGDQFHAYKPEAVRHIGLWDERFCGISRQGADYFYRCLLYNKDYSTIQDPGHHRVLNPIHKSDINMSTNWLVDADVRKIDVIWDNKLHGNDEIALKLILHKWGLDPWPWSEFLFNKVEEDHIQRDPLCPRSQCTNYITYPYFEKDIYDLRDKGYMVGPLSNEEKKKI